ncbi:MAG: hypothetical protein J4F46_02065, partial [Dehalococcoidia bacterium]|nr:hypothetical protein [Dehalococcoidia bacterium]
PRDANTDNIYEVTLVATDEGGQTTSEVIMVEVTNEDEDATTTIAVSLVQPREGQHVTVRYADDEGNPFVGEDGLSAADRGIVDPDGNSAADVPIDDAEMNIPAADVAWQWSRGTSRSGTFVDITEEENSSRDDASYLVIDDDRNHYLRVTAPYTDLEGEGKTLMATSLRPAIKLRDDQVAPAFPADCDLS